MIVVDEGTWRPQRKLPGHRQSQNQACGLLSDSGAQAVSGSFGQAVLTAHQVRDQRLGQRLIIALRGQCQRGVLPVGLQVVPAAGRLGVPVPSRWNVGAGVHTGTGAAASPPRASQWTAHLCEDIGLECPDRVDIHDSATEALLGQCMADPGRRDRQCLAQAVWE